MIFQTADMDMSQFQWVQILEQALPVIYSWCETSSPRSARARTNVINKTKDSDGLVSRK
jgi:hypothetical protein